MKTATCPTCGLTEDQIPPIARYVRTDTGDLVCNHYWGIPAKDVPDWRTHDVDGNPLTHPQTGTHPAE